MSPMRGSVGIDLYDTPGDLDPSEPPGQLALVLNPLTLYVFGSGTYQVLSSAGGAPAQSPASESTLGAVEFATEAEVQAGTTGILVASAARLKAELDRRTPAATETTVGLAEIATQTETNTATDDARIVTPLKLAGALANRGLHTNAYCELVRSTNQAISNNTNEIVLWTSEVRDPRDWHSTSVNQGRVTPGEAGMYLATLYGIWASNTTGERLQRILLNNTTAIATSRVATSVGSQGGQTTSTLIYLGASDYVNCDVFQTSGGSLDFDSSSRFTVARVV